VASEEGDVENGFLCDIELCGKPCSAREAKKRKGDKISMKQKIKIKMR
jgi:hypothetical protein